MCNNILSKSGYTCLLCSLSSLTVGIGVCYFHAVRSKFSKIGIFCSKAFMPRFILVTSSQWFLLKELLPWSKTGMPSEGLKGVGRRGLDLGSG